MGLFDNTISKFTDWFRLDKKQMCDKYGHDWYVDSFRCYESPKSPYWAVADGVSYKQVCCSRCGDKKAEHEVDRYSIQSLSLPSSRMRKLRKEGRIII